MKKLKTIFWIFILLLSCVQDIDDIPANTQLLMNTDISLSQDNVSPWTASFGSGISFGVSDEVFKEGFRSLYIERTDSTNINTGSWNQSVTGVQPSVGRRLILRAYLKGEDIVTRGIGSDVFISLRVFPIEDSNGFSRGRFISTQDRFIIEGDFDWTPLQLSLSAPPEIERLTVFLSMGPRVTGRVYFDDITLTVE